MAEGGSITIRATLDTGAVMQGVASIKSALGSIGSAAPSVSLGGLDTELETTADKADTLNIAMGNLAADGAARAAGALGGVASDVFNTGMEFDSALSKVQALSGASGSEMEAMEAKAREMGATTTFSATDAADAMGYMALAGWDAQQSMDQVGNVLNLAQAGEMGLADASDLVTDYLSAFGLQASDTAHFTDVLATASSSTNTSVEGLGDSFRNCAANAHATGVDVETTSALIGTLANSGIKGAQAGTALNAMFRDMTAKAENGAIAIGDASVEIMDANGNYRDMVDILRDVDAATQGMGDAEKAAALSSTFTADSIKGLNTILGSGVDGVDELRQSFYGCDGAASDMAGTMTDNLAGDVAAMGSAFDELKLKVNDSLGGAFRAGVQFITGKVVPALTVLIDNLPEVGAALGVVGAAIGAMKLGSLVSGLGGIAGIVGSVAAAFNPLTIAVGIIAAVVAAMIHLYRTNEDVRNAINSAWQAISSTVSQVAAVVGPLVMQIAATIGSALGEVAQTVLPLVVAAFNRLAALIRRLSPIVVAVFSKIASTIQACMEVIVPIVSTAWSIIKTVVSAAANLIKTLVVSRFNAIKSVVTSAMNGAKAVINAVWSAIGSKVASAVSSIYSKVSSTFSRVKDAMGRPFQEAGETIRGALDKIKGMFPMSIGRIFDNISLPSISVSGGSAPYGIGGKGSLPHFNVQWNAAGGIFTSMGMVGNQVFGEAGPEAVLPLSSTAAMNMVGSAIADHMGGISGQNITNVYIDGARVNGDREIEAAFYAFMTMLKRKGAM